MDLDQAGNIHFARPRCPAAVALQLLPLGIQSFQLSLEFHVGPLHFGQLQTPLVAHRFAEP